MIDIVLDWIFGKRIQQETGRYLKELAAARTGPFRQQTDHLLRSLKHSDGGTVVIGTAPWGQEVALPLADILEAFALVGGATGSGKSHFGLLLFEKLLQAYLDRRRMFSIGALDGKGDFFKGSLFLISKLERTHPALAQQLRDQLVLIDFTSRSLVTPYNLMARWPNTDPEIFAAKRADLIMDLLPGPDKLSLGASGVLRKLILLHSASNEPITKIADVVEDERLRAKLLARCRNPLLTAYFSRHFPRVPKASISAILRRMDALFACEGVRLAFDADSAPPDLARLQDEGKIVLINFFDQSIPRSVCRFLQALVFLDLTSAIFARQCPEVDYLWLCDEAQNFLATEQLREATSDIARTARTWHTRFIWFTQNVSTAVQDPRVLKILHTNIGWSLSLRGDPADCTFLKAALPVTGRRPRPQAHPFEQRSFYSEAEERTILFQEIASLPNRRAYLWLKCHGAQAIPITTADIFIPDGKQLEQAIAAIRDDPSVGMRLSRNEYERRIAERDPEGDEQPGDLGVRLRRTYQETRGQGEM